MTNAEYIKNLSKDELAAFLEKIYECGINEYYGSCYDGNCPWHKSLEEFEDLFRCPTYHTRHWLDEQVRPEQEIFEVN